MRGLGKSWRSSPFPIEIETLGLMAKGTFGHKFREMGLLSQFNSAFGREPKLWPDLIQRLASGAAAFKAGLISAVMKIASLPTIVNPALIQPNSEIGANKWGRNMWQCSDVLWPLSDRSS